MIFLAVTTYSHWVTEYWDTVQLLWPSLLTAGATSVAGAVIGWFVLLRREALLALALPQVTAAGAAIGMRFGCNELYPAIACVAGAVLWLARSKHLKASQALLPVAYIGALSVSFLLIADSGQHLADLEHRFTGMDVTVTIETARHSVPILLGCALLTAILWRRWLLLAQCPSAAQLAGVHPHRWDALFLVFLSVVVLWSTNALGSVMVLAMMFLPAATVLPWGRRIPISLMLCILCALVYLMIGTVLSVEMDWPLSQSCGAAGLVGVMGSHLASRVNNPLHGSGLG